MPGWSGATSCSLVQIRLSRLSSASSYSFVIVSALVGHASTHSPHRMQRR